MSAAAAVFDLPAELINFDKLPNSAHVDVKVVAAIFGVSIPTIWRWASQKKITAPVKVGIQSTRWNVGLLRAHLERCAA